MSMKRTRVKSYGSSKRYDDGPVSFNKSGQPESERTWEDYVGGKPDDAFVPYDMKAKFARGALISHAKFGKGIVLGVEENRMDVLFAEGKKKLGHGLG